jgi:hypothetical protein
MRLSVASLRRMIKGKLHVEFVRQELPSYSWLEVFRRYLRQYATASASSTCRFEMRLRRRYWIGQPFESSNSCFD